MVDDWPGLQPCKAPDLAEMRCVPQKVDSKLIYSRLITQLLVDTQIVSPTISSHCLSWAMTPTLSCVLTPVLSLICFFVCLFLVCFCCLFFRNQPSNEHQHSAWNPHCFILVASLKKKGGKLAKPATLLGPAILPLQVHSLGCLHIWPIATVPDGGWD